MLWARHTKRLLSALMVITALLLVSFPVETPVRASTDVTIVVDGRVLETDPSPFIVEGRTLVPLRAVFEALAADVQWHDAAREVTAQRGSHWVRLRIDHRLACLAEDCASAALLDVPARIRSDRTFVPLRFVATALGVGVSWQPETRTVVIDSSGAGEQVEPALTIDNVQANQVVSGPVTLRLSLRSDLAGNTSEVRWMLLDPSTGRGPVVARGPIASESFSWLPDPGYEGRRLLAAVAHDRAGKFVAGDVVPVLVALQPQVVLRGVEAGQEISGVVALASEQNFVATHVRYEMLDPASGTFQGFADADPAGPFNWSPTPAERGSRTIRVAAVDRAGRSHYSAPVTVQVSVPERLQLTGVSHGQKVDRPVTLGTSVNFAASNVRYVLRDPQSGSERVLASFDKVSSLRWLPAPGDAGARELLVEVTTPAGETRRSAPVPVAIDGTPGVFIETVGPKQVLADNVSLRSLVNVPAVKIEYQLVKAGTGTVKTVAAGSDPQATYAWTPTGADAGAWQLRAVAHTTSGTVASEAIPVTVHVGPLFGPKPVIAKDQFKDFASNLAVRSLSATGMSAALQVAQAILETGWGQSSPVDKYTGQASNNLFGIKGTGPAGSVTSNTWEEYHGVAYRIDAAFRAYHNLEESWQDHKALLLERERYAPFRAVMHDPIQGAWALRRAGYATDSQYPIKLINLMQQHGLFELDEMMP